jgi:DNA-binding MarR family transcriptional regulator
VWEDYFFRIDMKKFDPNDNDYNLWLYLAQVRTAMVRARQKEVRRYGITSRQASVLFVINANDKATPAEISRWLFRRSQSVTGILNRMEKQGLVRRVRDLHRKNMVRIELTQKGKDIYSNVAKRESMHAIMAALDDRMRKQLEACLERIQHATFQYLKEKEEMPFPS